MKRPPRALTGQMERLIEAALAPGRFVSYNANFSLVAELETAEHELAKLIPTDSAETVALYETFLAGCYEKAGEIDDSSGSFGQFVGELSCGWIKARQAARADPDETATRLLGRGNEALEAARAEYRERPSQYSYDDLMKYVPKEERAAWHEKAIEEAKGSDLHSQIGLLLETKELDHLESRGRKEHG